MVDAFRYDRLRDSKAAFREFERRNGKVGSVAMAAFILEAARITGRSAKSIERIVSGAPRATALPARRRRTLRDGVFDVTGRRRRRPALLGTVRLQNRGRAPAVVIQETLDADGNSQGVQFIVLQPGDVFESRHNGPPVIVVIIVIGLVVIVIILIGEAITDLIESSARCKLIAHTISRDHCLGTCPRNPVTGFPMTCTTTGTRPYFFGGTQATACACV